MESVRNHYKRLLLNFQAASKLFQDTGQTDLLARSLEELARFERRFIEEYSFEELLELHSELFPEGTLTTGG